MERLVDMVSGWSAGLQLTLLGMVLLSGTVIVLAACCTVRVLCRGYRLEMPRMNLVNPPVHDWQSPSAPPATKMVPTPPKKDIPGYLSLYVPEKVP